MIQIYTVDINLKTILSTEVKITAWQKFFYKQWILILENHG